MKNLLFSKDYDKMSWKELTNEAKRRGLDPRLTTFKGMEGAADNDMQKIIEQLSVRDQARTSRIAIYVSIIALVISLLSLIKQ